MVVTLKRLIASRPNAPAIAGGTEIIMICATSRIARIRFFVDVKRPVLPPGHKYTADKLIDEHTLLPFYSAFTDCARVKLIRSEMDATQETESFRDWA